MATAVLTDKTLKRLAAPKTGRLEIWDSIVGDDRTLPGTFGIRVTAKGTRTWVVMYRCMDSNKGKVVQKRHKLGNYPALSLGHARTAARDLLLEVSRGNNPAEEKQAAKEALKSAVTFSAAIDKFIQNYAKRETRSWRETQRVFDKYVKPELGDFRLEAVTAIHIRDLVENMAESTPIMANRTLATVRKFFNWAVEKQMVSTSPVTNISPPAKESSRDRVLTNEEIEAAWDAFETLGWPFGQAFQLLLVTGQRRDEVARMRWKDIDLKAGLWTLHRESTKADRMHEVPLSSLALRILGNAKRTSPEYVFSTNGKSPISGFSKAKKKVDEAVAARRMQSEGQENLDENEIADWRLHDLRRTVASQMAKMRVAPHVIEKVLNHSSGAISGVAAVYNRHGYTIEKREALDSWASELETIATKH
jgi:integrase